MITVYTADVSPLYDTACFRAHYERLSPCRRAKADRMRRLADKCLCVGASVLLDCGLAPHHCREADMTYGTNEHGKPCFLSLPAVHFSLSHAGQRAVAVFSDAEIGCDLERIGEFDMRLADRFFCPEEAAAIRAERDPARQADLFYRYWVLKESFVKAIGKGLTLPLDSFSFSLTEQVAVSHPFGDTDYHFIERFLPDGYRFAICTAGNGTQYRWNEISLATQKA